MKKTTFPLAVALAIAAAPAFATPPAYAPQTSILTIPTPQAAPGVLLIKDDKGDKEAKKHAKEARKAAEKAEKKAEKAAEKREKHAEKAEEKREKKAEKAAEKLEKRAEKAAKAEEKAVKKALKDDRKAHKEYHKLLEEARASDHYARRTLRDEAERETQARAVLRAAAPESRDMAALLSAGALALLGDRVAFAEVEDDALLTYRNCPPGLAKKDPPCVPPGLAAQGVTYEEWISYDEDELDRIYLDRRRGYLEDLDDTDAQAATNNAVVTEETPRRIVRLDDTPVPGEQKLLLTSAQIAELYDLRPAPAGHRYALIDGLPVLLNEEDYTSLLRINELALSADVAEGVIVAPTAALTQDELRRTYRLPAADPGYKYTVLNGELIQLQDQAFETLQLIRIARAVL